MAMIDIGNATFDIDTRVLRRSSGEEYTLRPQSAQVLTQLA